MSRTSIFLVFLIAALVVPAAALAVERSGHGGRDNITGSPSADRLFGLGGNDTIDGRAGGRSRCRR